MKHRRRKRRVLWWPWLLALGIVAVLAWRLADVGLWQFDREVPPSEEAARRAVVEQARSWFGAAEGNAQHRDIIDIYNAQEALPRGYPVTYEDAWCSAFVTTVAIRTGNTGIIPPECSCDEQIDLFIQWDMWEEDDDYIPLPGDVIFYDWDCDEADCTHWSDHVGIVCGTRAGYILVIEGNRDDAVQYRLVKIGDRCIRGYGVPDYT